jgi:protein Tex
VRVKEVDVERKRISLTMRSGAIDRTASVGNARPAPQSAGPRTSAPPPKASAPAESALAAALRRAQERR